MRCPGIVTHAVVEAGWVEVRLRSQVSAPARVLCRNPVGASPGDGVEVENRQAWDGRLRAGLPLLGVVAGMALGHRLGWGAATAAVLFGGVGLCLVPLVVWWLRKSGYGEWRVRQVIARPCVSSGRRGRTVRQ